MILTDREFDIVKTAVMGLLPDTDDQDFLDDLEVLKKRIRHSAKVRATKAAKREAIQVMAGKVT